MAVAAVCSLFIFPFPLIGLMEFEQRAGGIRTSGSPVCFLVHLAPCLRYVERRRKANFSSLLSGNEFQYPLSHASTCPFVLFESSRVLINQRSGLFRLRLDY